MQSLLLIECTGENSLLTQIYFLNLRIWESDLIVFDMNLNLVFITDVLLQNQFPFPYFLI